MPKAATQKVDHKVGKRKLGMPEGSAFPVDRPVAELARNSTIGDFRISKARFEAVMTAAERSGLLSEKSSRIAGRVSPELVAQAKKQTGIEGDTDLIAFALASVALEDNFAEVFKNSRGKISADLKLGF